MWGKDIQQMMVWRSQDGVIGVIVSDDEEGAGNASDRDRSRIVQMLVSKSEAVVKLLGSKVTDWFVLSKYTQY